MSEVRVILLAVAAWAGAVVSLPVHPAPAVVAVAVAVLTRRELLTVAAVAVLSASLSARADDAYAPAAERTLDGELAVLVTDPEPLSFGVRAEAQLTATGERVRLTAAGSAAAALGGTVAGETVEVWGRLRPIEPTPWLRSRHLVGTVNVERAQHRAGVAWYRHPSEWLRSAVIDGARSFAPDVRALYLGLVIGDDRAQDPAQQAQFRASGLTHLLAVSGQNVAFALAVMSPLVARSPVALRLVLTAATLAVFAVATRLEPSVVRATTTAGITALAVASGHRASGVRALSLAVTVLVLVDPFLIHSVGFRLSVAASAGILLLVPLLVERLPGPEWLRLPAAVTLAAQLGVSPILLSEFGPISLVTLPANLLAGWAAGAVMMLGLSIGVVAAVLPDPLAAFVQLPSGWLTRWIELVALMSSRLPAPRPDGRVLLLLVAALLAGWLVGPTARLRRLAILVGAVVIAASTVPHPPRGTTELAGGATWYPGVSGEGSMLVVGADADLRLVSTLVEQRIVVIDIVVLERGDRRIARLIASIRRTASLGLVLAPPQHRVVDARRLLDPIEIDIGRRVVEITPEGATLEVAVRVDGRASG